MQKVNLEKIIGNNKYLILITIISTLWLAFEYIFFGKNSYVTMFDMGDCCLPINIMARNELFNEGIFFWNKYIKTGVDLMSNGFIWFSLTNFVLPSIIFGGWTGYAISKLFGFFISFYFTYKLSKETFNFSATSSLWAAAMYSFIAGGNYETEGLISKPLFPMTIYLLLYISNNVSINKFKLIFTSLLAVLYSFSSLIIWDGFSLVIFFIFGYIFSTKKKEFIKIYFLFFLIVIFFQLIFLTPIILNSLNSHRQDSEFILLDRYKSLLNIIAHKHYQNNLFYLFIFNFFSSILVFFREWGRENSEKNLKIIFLLIIFCLICALIFPIMQLFIKDYLSVIKVLRADTILQIAYPFFLCLYASYLFNDKELKKKNILIILILFFFIN